MTQTDKKFKKDQALRLFRAGQLQQARDIYTELCHVDNQDANAWFMLGIINGQTGNFKDSEYCSRQVIRIQPENFPAWDNLGITLMHQGRSGEAETCFMEALRINPNDETAHNAVGNLHREAGRIEKAIASFNEALTINPVYAEAYNNLANIYKERCQFEQAQACYQQALKINPQYVDACFNLGSVQAAMGDYDEALTTVQKTLSMRPGFSEAIAAIAAIHEKRRDYEKAYSTLQPLLLSAVIPPHAALAFADIAPKIDKISEAIKALEKVLDKDSITPIYRQKLLYSLGDMRDKQGEYDQAFAAYQGANKIRPYPFNPKVMHRKFNELKSVFSENNVMPRSSNNSELPVFIVGMPRSGTSLVEQILACHPRVFGAGELPYIQEIVATSQESNNNEPYPEYIKHVDQAKFTSMANNYLDRLLTHSNKAERITDKMPHNFLNLGLIDHMLPKARIIHCCRSPMDTCLSIYFHDFNANHPYASDLENLGIYYKAYQSLMEHWKKVIGNPILEISYEALVENQEKLSRRIVEFCGLDWDNQCLEFHRSKRIVTTPSYDQVSKPIYSSSVGRWKAYEKHLKPLRNALE